MKLSNSDQLSQEIRQKVSLGLLKYACQTKNTYPLLTYLRLRFIVIARGTSFIPNEIVRKAVSYQRVQRLEKLGWISKHKDKFGNKQFKIKAQDKILDELDIKDNRYTIARWSDLKGNLIRYAIEVFAYELQKSRKRDVAHDPTVSKCTRGASVSLLAKILGISTRTVSIHKKGGLWIKGKYKPSESGTFESYDGTFLKRVEDHYYGVHEIHYHISSGEGYKVNRQKSEFYNHTPVVTYRTIYGTDKIETTYVNTDTGNITMVTKSVPLEKRVAFKQYRKNADQVNDAPISILDAELPCF